MHIQYQCQVCDRLRPIHDLFYCSGCNQLVCNSLSCVKREIEYYYCPICLDTFTSTELWSSYYHCLHCYLCPFCESRLCGIRDSESSPVTWRCFHCNWNSESINLSGDSVSDLQTKTFQLLRANHKSIKEELKSISKCICDELNIRSTPPALYSPTSIHRSLDKHLREEEQEKIRKTRQHLAETPESNPVLPHPSTLRCKYTIRCLHCLESNMSGMLLNPQIQPLLGDSSLSKANEIWNRVANLAVLAIPVLSIVSVDDEFVVLSVRNPAAEQYSTNMGNMQVTITSPWECSFEIPCFDEITVDRQQLASMNAEEPFVESTTMSSVILKLPRKEGAMKLHCVFSTRDRKSVV